MTPIFRSYPLLRQAAPRLSKQFFTCPAPLWPAATLPVISKATVRSSLLPALRRYGARHASTTASSTQSAVPSPLSSLVKSMRARPHGAKIGKERASGFFPEVSDKKVAYWLLGSAASVFGIVVFGGLTRLTESGLSITEWRPVTGSLLPTSAEAWASEFSKYKASPEFALLNPNMTLSEFKSIYYMEWAHRLWGRLVGLAFVLPAIYFTARRRVSRPMALRLFGISGLIGMQGFLGWWMVKSGLRDDLFSPGSHPRVSQYRLAAHLGTAFACYTAMLWNGLAILRAHRLLADPPRATALLATLRSPRLRPFQRAVALLAGLVATTALSGALVAGLDAGMIYNEFPLMGDGLTPPVSELFSDFYARRADKADRWWRNALENPALVQLDHRILATTTFTSAMALWAYSRWVPGVRALLPRAAHRGMHGVVGFVGLQVVLGITTLLYLVPVPVASAHQAGSLALLSMVLILGGRVWIPRRAAALVAQRMSGGMAKAVNA